MDGPRNYHAKWSQPYNETPTSNAFTDMWNLKKGQTELLCRTDADSQTLKNLWSLEETVWGVGGCAWAVGWKSCEIRLLWSLYNYRCDKFIWVIKKIQKKGGSTIMFSPSTDFIEQLLCTEAQRHAAVKKQSQSCHGASYILYCADWLLLI